MQPNRAALGPQSSTSSSGKQVVELNGYVIILVEGRDGKIKLYGSPADKDNLEVADEILDVNERKLEDLPRAEVIRHIHECIQSCMIKLRVKRRSDSRLAGELGNAVQDAFVIAVEQQARERLQRLSALKRVTPVDMSQLSIKLNKRSNTEGSDQTQAHDLSFLKEASPIYVTSLANNHITPGPSTLTTASASGTKVVPSSTSSISSAIICPPSQIVQADITSASSSTPTTITVSAVTATTATTLSISTSDNRHITVDSGTGVATYNNNISNIINNNNVNNNNNNNTLNDIATSIGARSSLTVTPSASSHYTISTNKLTSQSNIVTSSTLSSALSLTNNGQQQQFNKDTKLDNANLSNTSFNIISNVGDVAYNKRDDNISTLTTTNNISNNQIISNSSAQYINISNALNRNLTSSTISNNGNLVSSNATGKVYASGIGTKTTIGGVVSVSAQSFPSIGGSLVTANTAKNNLSVKATSATNVVNNYNKQQHQQQQQPITSTVVVSSTNNQLYNYNNSGLICGLSNNANSSSLNNNNLLISNLCNNNNSNNIINCGAGNTLSANFNTYVNSNNCDLLLANGHPPQRELSTLSEGDSEPFDDSNHYFTTLYEHQKQLSSSNSSISKGRTELLLGDQSLRQDTRPRRRSGSSIVVLDGEDLKPCLPDDYVTGSSHHIHHQHTTEKDLEMLTMLSVNQDNGPHREMAVDVPDTFIARNKTPPRYPPPRQQNQVNGIMPSQLIANMGTSGIISQQSQQQQLPQHQHLQQQQQTQFHQQFQNSLHSTNISQLQQQQHHHSHNLNHQHNNHQQTFQILLNQTPTHQHKTRGGSGGSGGGGSYTGVSLELESLNLFRKHSSSFDGSSKKSSSKEPSSIGSVCESTCDFDSISYHNMQNNNNNNNSNNNNNNNNNSKRNGTHHHHHHHTNTTTSCGSLSTRSSSPGDFDLPTDTFEMKPPHREMAVDVPDSFIEIIKAPPRYPPPPHLSSNLSSSSNASSSNTATTATTSNTCANTATNNNAKKRPPPQIVKEVVKAKSSISSLHGSFEKQMPQAQVVIKRNDELNGSVKPVPPPRDHLRMEKDGRLVNRAPAPQVPDRKISGSATGTPNHQIAQIVEPTLEQLDSIKKYQEQLRRRREEEERIAQQNEFLRASLRGSRKLQALQDGPLASQQTTAGIDRTSIGVDNDAYTDDEENEKIIGYGDLVAALQRLQTQLNKSGMAALAGRVTAAQNLLLGPGVANALAARAVVLQRRRPRITNPVCTNAQNLSKDVVELLAQSNSSAAIELGNLLTSHEMEGLLLAHDRVASLTDRTPSVTGSHSASSTISSQRAPQVASTSHMMNNNILKRPEVPISSQFGGVLTDSQDHIRIIQIEKSSEPLGATIRNEGEAVVIGRIVRGGAAEKSGLLHEGDEILEVNGIEMRGKTVNDVCALLGAMTGTLTFLIVPAGTPPPGGGRESAFLHVRAHFDYDPEDDLYIPCRELGISFQKGDVLHVISREDPNWWQAYREGEEDQTLAGLIPSQSFQHQRETMKLAIAEEAGLARSRGKESSKGATLLCARKGRKKKKKASSEAGYPLYATTAPDEPDPEEILTYEEVALYYPRATHKRPIVLIGPPNIGRHELRQRLMSDSDRFAAAVPHTSRPRREGEIPGQDYHFITRAQFEADILARKFVEHGEYEKAYYGTSLEAIRTVVASGKICVLNLHPQSLKLLRASDLKPYVVLVAPPSLEKLRKKKIRNGEPFKEEELKEIIATARDMEARWGHLFDMIIINNDTERAYQQLLAEISSLEREPQWVPASWVHNNRDES